MPTPKGYPCQEKEDRLTAEFATIERVGNQQYGLTTAGREFTSEAASDAAEAGSTTIAIVATGHLARAGDIVRFTAGNLAGREASVYAVAANAITLAETLPEAPGAGDTFQILRYTRPVVSATGAISVANTFILDGANQVVTEDTVTPANNRPLPVKLTGFDGDVRIDAANLDLHVQLEHTGADYDSVRLGDGTDLLAINADGSINAELQHDLNYGAVGADTLRTAAQVGNAAGSADFGPGVESAQTLRTTPATDTEHLLNTRHETAGTPLSFRPSNGTNFADFGSGVVGAETLRTTPATDSEHLLAARHEAVGTPLSVKLGTGVVSADFNSGVAGAGTIRTTPATDSEHLLATRHETGTTPLANRLSDGTNWIDSESVATAQKTHAGSTAALETLTYILGWDGNTHREIAVDGNGYVKTAEQNGTIKADIYRISHVSSPMSTAAYTQVDASTVNDIHSIEIFDSSGETLVLAVGADGFEADQFFIPPGGNGHFDFYIPSGSRIAVKPMSANTASGEFILNTKRWAVL